MAERAKHAFGALENIEVAKNAGKIDAFDILFVKDANGKPYVGWLDSENNTVIVNENLDADLDALEVEIAKKASSVDVSNQITDAVVSVLNETTAYTDQKVKTAIDEMAGAVEVIEF